MSILQKLYRTCDENLNKVTCKLLVIFEDGFGTNPTATGSVHRFTRDEVMRDSLADGLWLAPAAQLRWPIAVVLITLRMVATRMRR